MKQNCAVFFNFNSFLGGFFNPGNSAGVAEQAQPNKNDAFEEDLDEIEDESVVL